MCCAREIADAPAQLFHREISQIAHSGKFHKHQQNSDEPFSLLLPISPQKHSFSIQIIYFLGKNAAEQNGIHNKWNYTKR
jgi:hypothetical protein